MRLVRALVLPMLASLLLLGALAQPSAAENSWSGTCSFENYTDFWPPQTKVPTPSGYYSRGSGHCKGTLNGKPFDGTGKIDLWANMRTSMSCVVGVGPGAGPGYLTFVTGAARQSTAATPQKSTSKPAHKSRKRSRHKTRHSKKRASRAGSARRAAVRAAASDPPRDPSQPVPRPPIPNTPDPTVEIWLDIVTSAPNLIYGDMQGAYRGYAVGTGFWNGEVDDFRKCLVGDGIPGAPSKMSWTTVTELRG